MSRSCEFVMRLVVDPLEVDEAQKQLRLQND